MAGAAHTYPNAVKNLASKAESWATGSTELCVGLVSSTSVNAYSWNGTSQAHTTVANFLAGSGAGVLIENSGGGYNRLALSSVTFTTSGLVNTLSCATISWTATANWGSVYAFFYDGVVSSANDATTNELIEYWDFGGTVSVVNGGNFTLTINASGLLTFTSS